MVRKAIIPVAGYGTRLFPVTKVVPKELFPIGNKPVIHHIIEELIKSGIKEVIFVCHRNKIKVIDYFIADDKPFSPKIVMNKKQEIEELEEIRSSVIFHVVYQEKALGLGHAVLCARKLVKGEPFLVILPDILICQKKPATLQLIEGCKDGSWGVLLTKITQEEVYSYGVVESVKTKNKDIFLIQGAVEKPQNGKAPSNLGILGRYLFMPDIFDLIGKLFIPTRRDEIQLTDAINTLAHKSPGKGILCSGNIFDTGTTEGFLRTIKHFGLGLSGACHPPIS